MKINSYNIPLLFIYSATPKNLKPLNFKRLKPLERPERLKRPERLERSKRSKRFKPNPHTPTTHAILLLFHIHFLCIRRKEK